MVKLFKRRKKKQTRKLYETAQKIYPKAVQGRFNTLRVLCVWSLLGLYYVMPWISWNETQAVLFDLPNRRFHILGLTFWPQDLLFFSLTLIVLVLSLFLFTAVGGRLWCGYACPQTVWTELFIWIERKVEGTRNQQMKLDKAPLSVRKIKLKATKHTLWIVVALFTGFTFVGYFSPIRELYQSLISWQLSGWEQFWIFLYSLATYGNAGKLREQICIYMCPYARFQSVMFDKDTLIVTYDESRGEPRGKRKKGDAEAKGALGDCIDCKQCVQVCPTGIDIRDGLQFQCIACSACIDACDQMMDQVGYPRGLVKYATEHGMTGKAQHILRPRVIIYTFLLISLIVGIGIGIASRKAVDLDVIRDRKQLYVELDGQLIENIYTLKIMNLDREVHEYVISVEGIKEIRLETEQEITVEPGKMAQIPIRVIAPLQHLTRRNQDIVFKVMAKENNEVSKTKVSRFMAPAVK